MVILIIVPSNKLLFSHQNGRHVVITAQTVTLIEHTPVEIKQPVLDMH